MKKYIIAAAFIITFSFAAGASAATIYVNSSTGNDSTGNGSSGTPFATFTKGYASSSPGDTLNLTGTFTWSNGAETGSAVNTGFTLAKNLTITGQGTSTTFIEASTTAGTANRSVFTVNSGVTVTIQNLTVRYGVSTNGSSAGGITDSGTLILQNAAVNNNTYNTSAYSGAGGIYVTGNPTQGNTGASLTISTSTISNNTDNGLIYGAGGVYAEANGDIVTITASTFANNSAVSSAPTAYPYSYADLAGALAMRTGTLTITNSTFSGNSTNAYGGAFNLELASTIITNSTIANNTATADAGGILYTSDNVGSDKLWIENTIIAKNTGNSLPQDFYAVDSNSANSVNDNGYNIIGYSVNKTWSGTGDSTGSEPSLNLSATLALNGAIDGVQTLALSAGSNAINAGTTAANSTIAVPTTDERGLYRLGPTDIGAYEFSASTTVQDTTAPIVVITNPTSGGTAFASISLTATSSDNVGVTGVQFLVDGALVGASGTTSPYTVTFDTTPLSNGAHTVTAVAHDAALDYATTSLTIYVGNGCGGSSYEVNGVTTSVSGCGTTMVTYAPSSSTAASSSGSSGSVASNRTSTTTTATSTSATASSTMSTTTSTTTVAMTVPVSATVYTFTTNLKYGNSGPDVMQLQDFLQAQGLLTVTPTGYFGVKTRAALAAFQKAHDISPAVGYFGPITRGVVNTLW